MISCTPARVFLIFLFIGILNSCNSQPIKNQTASQSEKIDEILGLYTAYGGFNGSVLIAHKGEIIIKKGYGWANMEWDIQNEPHTKFKIASLTKSFTATLIMQLVVQEKLGLHQPISEYLPEYSQSSWKDISIHHLLTHTSGIPNFDKPEKVSRPKELVEQFANEPLDFTPGEKFGYSNSGYILLGYIIETITGKEYAEVLQENILSPLSMNDTGFHRHKSIIKNMSSGYNKIWGKYHHINNPDASSAYAAGAMYSTVEDLLRWNNAVQNSTLLPREMMDEMFKKHVIDPDFGGHYGYGWEIIDRNIGNTQTQVGTISHGGAIEGYRALNRMIPSDQSSIIILNNTNYAFLNAISQAILNILYDQAYEFPKKPIIQFMKNIVENEGMDKGIKFFELNRYNDEYHVSEQDMIVYGYQFLEAKNPQDAASIFRLAIRTFPDRDNPYDSYAEAMVALGRKEEAIANYQKSLEINPNNKNAERMLEKLAID